MKLVYTPFGSFSYIQKKEQTIIGSFDNPVVISSGENIIGIKGDTIIFIKGVENDTLLGTEQIEIPNQKGIELTLIGVSDSEFIKLEHRGNLLLNGYKRLLREHTIKLSCVGNKWIEISRNY